MNIDAEAFPVMTWPTGDNPMVVRVEVAKTLQRERDEAIERITFLECEIAKCNLEIEQFRRNLSKPIQSK